jgi:hypothetical protein
MSNVLCEITEAGLASVVGGKFEQAYKASP